MLKDKSTEPICYIRSYGFNHQLLILKYGSIEQSNKRNIAVLVMLRATKRKMS